MFAAHSMRARRARRLCWCSSAPPSWRLHSFSLGAPILIEEMKAAGVTCRRPEAGNPILRRLAGDGPVEHGVRPVPRTCPGWTEDYFAFAVGSVYQSGIFTPKFIELISIALDASITHMYAPGVRRHIKGALKAGATPEEIMTVLQLCVSMGMQACTQGVPILAEELEKANNDG